MLKNLENWRIFLGSQSPRRQFLLKETGLQFEVCVKDSGEEIYPENLPSSDVAMFLAQKKAEPWFGHLNDNEIVITADTVVILNNEIITKPLDRDDAVKMLTKLSGNLHTVVTGVCVMARHKTVIFDNQSQVYFNEISLEEIEFYVDNYQPFDKAGAYGIQEWIGYVGIRKIDGCFFNVMGLPVQKLWEELKKF